MRLSCCTGEGVMAGVEESLREERLMLRGLPIE
jgi:hypothetical protein